MYVAFVKKILASKNKISTSFKRKELQDLGHKLDFILSFYFYS